jgi:hypothetical protein
LCRCVLVVSEGNTFSKRLKYRQCRPLVDLGPTGSSCAVKGAIPKRTRLTVRLGAGRVNGDEEFGSLRPGSPGVLRRPFCLKQFCFPGCGAAETLNWHSHLYGNDPAAADGQVLRGQRVFCSDRGQRGGCGRTFSIWLADRLPRHTFTGPSLWALLSGLLKGKSIRAAFELIGSPPFALETRYHLLHRLREELSSLRCLLSGEKKAPASTQSDPLLQTVEHLRLLFPKSPCPVADFQIHFQRPLLE